MILLDEDAHLEQRKLMLPAFHGERMQRLTGLMAELAEREVAPGRASSRSRCTRACRRLTLEIILRAVFGLDAGPALNELRDTLTGVLAFGESPLSLLPPLQRRPAGRGRCGRFARLTRRRPTS